VIEMRHLKYFLTTADHLNFTLAAKTLHLAQPALSMNIKQLEDELGVPLFVRANNKVQLTEAGRFFRIKAEALFQQLNQATNAIRRIGGQAGESLSLGFHSHVFFAGLSQPIERLHQTQPEITINAQECLHDELLPRLKALELDAICSDIPINDPGLNALSLKSLPLFCAIPSGHRLAKAQTIRMSDLFSEPLIYPLKSENQDLHLWTKQQFSFYGFEPHLKGFYRTYLGGLGMVQCGMGIMVCYELNVPVLDGVVIRPIVEHGLDVRLRVFWRKGEPMAVALGAFLDACRHQSGDRTL
jgi:DNA-binding transcriptional LysR family regulator